MLQCDFDECFLKIDRRLEIYFKFILENCERMLYNNKSIKDNPILSLFVTGENHLVEAYSWQHLSLFVERRK